MAPDESAAGAPAAGAGAEVTTTGSAGAGGMVTEIGTEPGPGPGPGMVSESGPAGWGRGTDSASIRPGPDAFFGPSAEASGGSPASTGMGTELGCTSSDINDSKGPLRSE